MKRTLALGLAGLLAFLVILVVRAPASWLLPAGPSAPFTCSAIEGTLWSGLCGGLTVQHQAYGDVSWDLQPLQLFTGHLAAGVSLGSGAIHGSGALAVSFGGTVTVSDARADFPLDPKLLPAIPAGMTGSAHLDLRQLVLRKGAIEHLEGRLEVHDLTSHEGKVTPLGSYAVTFPPGASGDPVGELKDLGGPLSLEGTLRLTRTGQFDVQGLISARPEASPELVSNLRFLGSPDPSGRRQFSMQGSL
ncbi:MAG: type II secretion system protein N [Proteobacteria bacterium]|nr:type II secretion system protein N [Pseudomonadota bacterium]